jgi:hypothetical protein
MQLETEIFTTLLIIIDYVETGVEYIVGVPSNKVKPMY